MEKGRYCTRTLTISSIAMVVMVVSKFFKLPILPEQSCSILVWQGLLGTFVQEEHSLRHCFKYPDKRYVNNTTINKLLFSHETMENVTPEAMVGIKFISIFWCVSSITMWLQSMGDFGAEYLIAVIYAFISCLALVIYLYKTSKIVFYLNFKRLTIHNWMYLFGFYNLSKPFPTQHKLGACIILKQGTGLKKRYYTVQLKKSGNIYKKVIYCGDGECDLQKSYILHEIRDSRYMT